MAVAESLARLGCQTVDLTGGEPLLRPDWDALCRGLRALGLQVALITNGTLLSDENLDRAVAAGVGVLGVSLDGMLDTHDATRLRPCPGPSPWEQTVSGIERALGRVTTRVITQVNRNNLRDLPRLRLFLRDLGVRRWQLQLAVPTGWLLDLDVPYIIGPEDLEELTGFIAGAIAEGGEPAIDTGDTIGYYTDRELVLRKRTSGQGLWLGCQAGIRVVAITYDGKVRGCSALPRGFDAGDLRQESLEEIWSDPERFAYCTRFDPRRLLGACARCRFGALCRAGCTSMAYWVTGTIYRNPYCLLQQRERLQTSPGVVEGCRP